jgi:CMP-N-acetylneuraminic acid synthetase
MVLQRCQNISSIVVSSDDDIALKQALEVGAVPSYRDPRFCGDHVDLGELFSAVLAPFQDEIVYWAHPTSPFVTAATIDAAVQQVRIEPTKCVLGVQRLQEFLWSRDGPINYDPLNQPRSQDLSPMWRVTGGIHVATGGGFIERGALAFEPVVFQELSIAESLDINDEGDWTLCAEVAPIFLPRALGYAVP